jgi:PKD repeat protein
MKHVYSPVKTVTVAITVLILVLFCGKSFAQNSTTYFPVTSVTPDYGDSLDGFNETAFLAKASIKGLDTYETKMYINQCKRTFVNRRYHLYVVPPNRDLAAMRIPNNVAMLPCTNMDFETASFTGWTGFIGDNTLSSSGPLQNITNGIFSNGMDALVTDMLARHTIVSAASGTDMYGGFPCVAPGGSYSCRLGNTYANYQGEAIEQTFTVAPGNTSFTYQYAAVLNDGGHSAGEQPYFRIEMFDQSGNLIPCAQYYVEAAGGNTPGFVASAIDPFTYYKPWTTVNADLTAYMASTVTIRFTAAGCIYAGHFGYAYVDASCLPYQITTSDSLCQGGSITLTAPIGATNYLWTPGGQTTQSITVNTAGSYTVDMTSVTGCHTTLTRNVVMYPTPVAAFTPNSTACASNFTFTNTSSVSTGGLSYHWDFGDPSVTNDTSNVQNPSYTYNSAGTFTVTLTVTSTSGCTATITQVVNPGNGGIAAFSNTTVCQGTATVFTDSSQNASTWNWHFGDPASGPND